MELFLWDKFKDGEVNEKIKYWVDIWEELIKNFNKNSYGLNLSNPHIVIKDIIDEVEFNKMRNKENKTFLLKQIDSFLKNDNLIKDCYKVEFESIREYLNSDKHEYLLVICKQIKKVFEGNGYFEKLYNRLKSILMSDDEGEDVFRDINSISQSLIVELILKGFHLDSIKDMPVKSFYNYTVLEDERVIPNYPYHGLKYNDYKDEETYLKLVKKKIDSLTILDRLDALGEHILGRTPMELYVIIPIEGMVGDLREIEIKDVLFYNPRFYTHVIPYEYIDDEKNKKEFFSVKENRLLNARVKVGCIDWQSAKDLAIDKLEEVFNVLRCIYKTKCKFKAFANRYIITDLSGRQLNEGYELDVYEIEKERYSLDVEEVSSDSKEETFFEKICNSMGQSKKTETITHKKLMYSLHWFRKGEESKRAEDRLLNYWISMENLMDFKSSSEESRNIILNKGKETSYSLIKELVPCLEIMGYKNSVLQNLFYYVRNLTYSNGYSEKGIRRGLKLPEELRKRCNLIHTEGKVSLLPFLENLEEVSKCTDSKIIKDKIRFSYQFYTDRKFAENAIRERMQVVQDEILYIYRYRNKIVHNAHYDNALLPHIVSKAKEYANSLLLRVMYDYYISGEEEIKDIYIKWHFNSSIFMRNLSKNENIDIINYEFD
ncbi:hypothetical protein SAMN04487919_101467 [Bacillus sp. ok061]|uniref:hypothetical protein n=1 Tax=Bacillus sp. ok061 TaxID=1761766 RepID=UPI00089E3A65|nr:hypothetical protein [Bacillus sp. ok061]SEF52372.1 hypothetical protein SAMN04487919_101467 [Bacillus sp. ok061]